MTRHDDDRRSPSGLSARVDELPAKRVAAPTRLLRIREVLFRTGMSRATLYRRIAQGDFPKAYSLGGRIVGWADTEVDAWIACRTSPR